MAIQYYKRFRMEFNLRRRIPAEAVPTPFRLLPWNQHLLHHHAEVKYRSFCGELDSLVFPCLGEESGCLQLMHEISERREFLPGATWLAVYHGDRLDLPTYSGTIQGLRVNSYTGSIQNVGTVPEHRGRGIATALVLHALHGFQQSGLARAYLEVTAQNIRAVRLYKRLGFQNVRTDYKAVESVFLS